MVELFTGKNLPVEYMVIKYKSIEDWEREVGRLLRDRRLSENLSVDELAKRANISEKSLRNLEHGRGSSLQTFIKVLRAMKKEAWFEQLGPDKDIVSPIDLLFRKSKPQGRQRASKKK